MKTSNKIIIYDDGCPLCSAYTSAFVKTGFLDEAERRNFSNIDIAIFELVDKNKCHNEIPLVDIETKQVWYGIDALLEILDRKVPFLKWIGNIKPVKWFLQLVYNFISYNRKVIVASTSSTKYDCSPDFNIKYRISFLIVFLLFNSYMLWPFYNTVFSNSFISQSSYLQLQTGHFALVSCNIICALFLTQKKAFEFLGQVNMLALICILLLVPLHLLNKFATFQSSNFNNVYLVLVSLIIANAYYSRMKYAGVLSTHRWIPFVNIISVAAFLIYLVK